MLPLSKKNSKRGKAQEGSRPLLVGSNKSPDVGTASNFWEKGGYNRVVKRVDESAQALDDFTAMIKERADIEKKYAASLRAFSRKWDGKIQSGPEDPVGTLKVAWNSLLKETNGLFSQHTSLQQRLLSEVQDAVKDFRKERFPRHMLHNKPTKAAGEAFDKAQKPWVTLFEKAERRRTRYFSASRTAHALTGRLREVEQDVNTKADDIIKLKVCLKSQCECRLSPFADA